MTNIGNLFSQANTVLNQNSVLTISPTGAGFAQPTATSANSVTAANTPTTTSVDPTMQQSVGTATPTGPAIANFGPWLAGFVVMGGVLIIASESDTWGRLATAFAVLIAATVAFKWGGSAVTELKGLL